MITRYDFPIDEGLQKDLVVNNGLGYLTGGGVELDWIIAVATPTYHTSDNLPCGRTVCEYLNHESYIQKRNYA
jgi:hypothetical protein